MSTIYWKFKNTKSEFSSITFDSTHVSILDLKRAIIKQKGLLQSAKQPFDLSITNAHTGVEYTDETGPIPRNLAVIVRRLPAARNQHRKLYSPMQNNSIIATADNISKKQLQTISERLNQEFGPALFNDAQQNAAKQNEVNAVESETMGIIDMMNRRMNSSATAPGNSGMGGRRPPMRRPMNRPMGGGGGGGPQQRGSYQSQRGDPPPGYVCHRCHVSGHWIQDCPTNGDPKFDKKNHRAGGMRSHLPVPKPATPEKLSGDTSATTDIPTQQVIVGTKCYQIPTNVYESFNGDHSKIKAYIEISSGTHSFSQSTTASTTATSKIDSRYKCEICQGYYVDARFTPCCHSTYCNECIRQKITNNPTEIRCPSCEDLFAARLLAKNVRLQDKVDQIVRNQPKHTPASTAPTPTVVTVPTTRQVAPPIMPQPMVTPAPTTGSALSGATQTIQIRHNASMLRPTVVLRHGVVTNTAAASAATTTTTATTNEAAPAAPQTLDTSRFSAPSSALSAVSDPNVVCIECKQRGHKYKDCPLVREKANAANATRMPPLSSPGSDADDATKGAQNTQPNVVTQPQSQPQRLATSVQLMNVQAAQAAQAAQANAMSMAQMKLNAVNSLSMVNLRNRLTVNNILMNAALHRVNVNKPRIINSSHLAQPMASMNGVNPLLLAQRGLPYLQQQRMAMQQRGLGPAVLQQAHGGATGGGRVEPQPLPAPHANGNGAAHVIPNELLTATIANLREVMASNDQEKVTAAINEAFVKLGANDAESKRKVLEQLVAASTKDSKDGEKEKKSKHRKKSSKHRKRDRKDRDRKSSKHRRRDRDKDEDRDGDRDRKRKHRHRERSGSKHKDRDRDRSRDRDRDKDRERRHKKRSRDRKRKKRDRSSRDRERESDAGSTSVTTESAAAAEDEGGAVSGAGAEIAKEVSPEKQIVSVPDFDDSPPKKKQRTS